MPDMWRRGAGWLGVCPGPAGRGIERSGASAAGSVPSLSGDACVVAGDRVGAQSVCDGTDLGRTVGPLHGLGHRRIGAALGVPAATVRGWLRRAAQRLEAMRAWFLTVAVTAGVDVRIPDGSGCRWKDLLASVATATAAIGFRFGALGLGGAVTPARVAAAASGGRLLAPGWPPAGGATRIAPDAADG
jgi:hypothetical protein